MYGGSRVARGACSRCSRMKDVGDAQLSFIPLLLFYCHQVHPRAQGPAIRASEVPTMNAKKCQDILGISGTA